MVRSCLPFVFFSLHFLIDLFLFFLLAALSFALSSEGFLQCIRCFFANNTSPNSGGAMLIRAPLLTVQILDSEFHGNTAEEGSGGALYLDVKAATIRNSLFTDNVASTDGGMYPLPCSSFPAFSLPRVYLFFRFCFHILLLNLLCLFLFSGAVAVVITTTVPSLTLFNSTFLSNSAGFSFFDPFSLFAWLLVLIFSLLIQLSGLSGGALALSFTTTTIDSLVCRDNFAPTGGCLSVLFSPLALSNSLFESNRALHDENSALPASSCSNLTVPILSDSSFGTFENGGAVACTSSAMTFNNTILSFNMAKSGGAFSLYKCSLAFTHSSATNNQADVGGFGYFGYLSSGSFQHSNFSQHLSCSGGVFFAQNARSLVAHAITARLNTALQFGGILLTSNTPISVDQSSFLSNTGVAGGVYYWLDGPAPSFLHTSFVGNKASFGGYGDVYASPMGSIVIANKALLESTPQSLGLALSPSLSVLAQDLFNQTMTALLFASASIMGSAFSGSLSRVFVSGVAAFDDLRVVAHSNTTVVIIAGTTSGTAFGTEFLLFTEASCPRGTYLTPTTCNPCSRGRYSADTNTLSDCEACPAGMSAIALSFFRFVVRFFSLFLFFFFFCVLL
jgi:hypothetical protein